MACTGCEIIPVPVYAGTLVLAPNLPHTRKKMVRMLASEGFDYQHLEGDNLGIALEDRGEALMACLSAVMSPTEQEACRSVVVRDPRDFALAQLSQIRPLRALISLADSAWLLELMRQERILVHYQPIMSVSDATVPVAYECLARGRSETGELIPPGKLFGAAREADLLHHLDRLTRVAAIEQAGDHGLRCPLFINFNPTSIYDPAYCLATTINAAHRSSLPSSNFVFEVVESDAIQSPDHLLGILSVYREAGFPVALDDLGAGYGSLNLLSRLRPDYVKLDMELIRNVDSDRYKANLVQGIIRAVKDNGGKVIAEGIETEAEWHWVRDSGIDLVQGYYFARPAAPPPMMERLPAHHRA